MGLNASAFTSGASSFLKAQDVQQAGPQKFVIADVEAAETPDGKPALQLVFEGGKKLTLNKTNARRLAGSFGDSCETWKGRTIIIYFDPDVMYAGQAKGGIRVKVPVERPKTGDPDLDDLGF